MYVPLQVNRFAESVLLIVQYRYLKSYSGDFHSPESDPPHKIMRYWIYYWIWLSFSFRNDRIRQLEMICIGGVPKGISAGPALKYFTLFIGVGGRDTTGNRTSRESRHSETSTVWRNASVRFALHMRILVRGVNQFESAWDVWPRFRLCGQPTCILPCSHLVITGDRKFRIRSLKTFHNFGNSLRVEDLFKSKAR